MHGVTVTPARCDVRIYPGTDFPFTAVLTDKTGGVNITSDSVKLTIFSEQGATLFTQTNAPADHTDAVNGKTPFLLSRTLTGMLRKGQKWTYEVRRIFATPDRQYVHIVGEIQGI